VKRLYNVPALKKEIDQFLKEATPPDMQKQAHEALTASVAELILEGLHVENRLNKNLKGTEATFKR
jgi:hypothetical protein